MSYLPSGRSLYLFLLQRGENGQSRQSDLYVLDSRNVCWFHAQLASTFRVRWLWLLIKGIAMPTLCHCIPERSICINGRPFLCYRCFGILVGFQLTFWSFIIGNYLLSLNMWQLFPFELLSFTLVVILMVPLVVDGFTQKWEWRLSNNPLRLTTGLLFGLGMQFILFWSANLFRFYASQILFS